MGQEASVSARASPAQNRTTHLHQNKPAVRAPASSCILPVISPAPSVHHGSCCRDQQPRDQAARAPAHGIPNDDIALMRCSVKKKPGHRPVEAGYSRRYASIMLALIPKVYMNQGSCIMDPTAVRSWMHQSFTDSAPFKYSKITTSSPYL